MAMPIIDVPIYPDVPPDPGVPPVRRQPGQAFPQPIILIADAVQIFQMFLGPQWGIFSESGAPIVEVDSVVAVEFRKEFRISNYPIEGGSFQSYNKVETPFDAKLTLACGDSILPGFPGSQSSRRQTFLDSIATAVASLDMYSVVTPEVTYTSANLIHYDYRRNGGRGVSLLEVDVWVEEVRITAEAQFTKSAAGQGETNTGSVQPTPPTASQDKQIPSNLT